MLQTRKHLFVLLIALITTKSLYSQYSKQTETYVGTTPCSIGTRPVPGISKTDSIDQIQWELKLNALDEGSGTYVLNCDYGLSKQGTMLIVGGGKHIHREGKYVVSKGGKTTPAAVTYKLDPEKPTESISFMRLNANLLHLLDNDQQLMIGTGAWSYTLNKLQK